MEQPPRSGSHLDLLMSYNVPDKVTISKAKSWNSELMLEKCLPSFYQARTSVIQKVFVFLYFIIRYVWLQVLPDEKAYCNEGKGTEMLCLKSFDTSVKGNNKEKDSRSENTSTLRESGGGKRPSVVMFNILEEPRQPTEERGERISRPSIISAFSQACSKVECHFSKKYF